MNKQIRRVNMKTPYSFTPKDLDEYNKFLIDNESKRYNLNDIDYFKNLEKDIELADRQESVVSNLKFFQKIDRILSEHNISVNSSKFGNIGSLGSCDRDKGEILIEETFLENCSKDEINLLLTKGINYHELSHFFFSNYKRNALNKALKDYGADYIRVFQMLEDQRVDVFMRHLYPKTKDYLSAATYEFTIFPSIQDLEKNPNENKKITTHLLVYGKKFLNKSIRTFYREAFYKALGNENAKKVEGLINDFITEKNAKKRLEISHNIYQLVKDYVKDELHSFPDVSEFSGEDDKIDKEQKSNITKQVKKNVKNSADKENNQTEDDKNSNNQDQSMQGHVDFDKLRNELSTQQKQILKNLSKELESELDILNLESLGCSQDTTIQINIEKYQLSAEDIRLSEILRQRLRKLKLNLRPHYVKKKRCGKIDLKKAMNFEKTGDLKIFKKWKQNRLKKFDVALAIVNDVSGSMASYVEPTVVSSIILQKALVETKGKICCMQFGSTYSITKDFDDKFINTGIHNNGGGTNPSKPVALATYKLARRKEKIKILVMISDAEYPDKLPEIAKAKKKGIHCIYILARNTVNNLRLNNVRAFDTTYEIPSLTKFTELSEQTIKNPKNSKVKKIVNNRDKYKSSMINVFLDIINELLIKRMEIESR